MKLENIVASVELCKRIPEGMFDDSIFVHIGNNGVVLEREEYYKLSDTLMFYADNVYPAPTLNEIMELIPDFAIADVFVTKKPIDSALRFLIDMKKNENKKI